jgi:carboxypeptidase PM20D1
MSLPLIASILLIIVIFLGVLLRGACRLKPTPMPEPLSLPHTADDARAVERFQEMLRCGTVWGDDAPGVDHAAFDAFIPRLQALYPRVFAQLELTRVNTYGLMLRWTGHDPSLAPVVLMAHHDVVEADPTGWTHDPFAADIADGRIWARGAVDTKCVLAALFEATDRLLAEGYIPPRDIYLCSSNCEEDRGPTAAQMVEVLEAQGRIPCLVVDEGGAVIEDAPLGIDGTFALIGVSEKGVFDALITTDSPGGHASTPSLDDATGKLVSGLDALQKNPPRAALPAAVETLLKELAAHGRFGLRLVFGNLWLFRPLVISMMKHDRETAALLRSTYAITQLEGSKAANVLPHQAGATVNVRVAPSESVEQALARIETHFDTQTTFATAHEVEPSPSAPFGDETFAYLRQIIHSVYPEAGIAPYLQTSCSDARHFHRVCPHTYRFAGFLFRKDQRAAIHGQDENLDVASYLRGIVFYQTLIAHLDILGH